MPYTLVHDGLVREFEFFMPNAIEYWIEQIYLADNSDDGAPLLIMLHGFSQEPAGMLAQWNFPELFNLDDDVSNKFCVLVPYGFAQADSAEPIVAGLSVRRPTRSWSCWPGFNGPDVDDVGFIEAAIAAATAIVQRLLDNVGSARNPFDPNKIFLFGYSNGGMMAYRLVKEKPDYFAAAWLYCTAYGGKSTSTSTSYANGPDTLAGTKGVSLYFVHGDDNSDMVVPPGLENDTTSFNFSKSERRANARAQLPANNDRDYARWYRTADAATAAYVTYNDGFSTTPGDFRLVATSTTEPSIDPADASTMKVYADFTTSPPYNPVVVSYRDPALEHTNLFTNPYPDLSARKLWDDWFTAHPRP